MKLGEYLHQFGSALWGDGDEDTTAVSLVRALFSQTLSYQATDDLSTSPPPKLNFSARKSSPASSAGRLISGSTGWS